MTILIIYDNFDLLILKTNIFQVKKIFLKRNLLHNYNLIYSM